MAKKTKKQGYWTRVGASPFTAADKDGKRQRLKYGDSVEALSDEDFEAYNALGFISKKEPPAPLSKRERYEQRVAEHKKRMEAKQEKEVGSDSDS